MSVVRLAARAAGQDAGAAALSLISWALWLRGHADRAQAQIEAALERADAVEHPHTQAYVCYYASVLHALQGEFATALRHAERCVALSEEHGFGQWRSLLARNQGYQHDDARSVIGRTLPRRGAGRV